jgi:hypothetical protein
VLLPALVIFLGAFLLFQVQPLMGKFLLPWFGGGPGVWTTCLLFFQTLLLGGYAYAHWLTSRLDLRRQSTVHLGLLVAAIVCLPIMPGAGWKPAGSEAPIGRILLLLAANVGLPYLALSATGPLVQRWFSLSHPALPALRAFQRRVAARAGELPVCLRAAGLAHRAWLGLVGRTRRVRRIVRRADVAVAWTRP